jgi:hypothetical protein
MGKISIQAEAYIQNARDTINFQNVRKYLRASTEASTEEFTFLHPVYL